MPIYSSATDLLCPKSSISFVPHPVFSQCSYRRTRRRPWSSKSSSAGTLCLPGFCCWLLCTLIQQIIPSSLHVLPDPNIESVISACSQGHTQSPPPSHDSTRQRVWDAPHIEATYNIVLKQVLDHQAKACLLALSCPKSGAWFHALPIVALGLCMNDDVVSVAVGLQLGVPLCQPHQCAI